MKNTLSKYKNSIKLAKQIEPTKSIANILLGKINRKIRCEYDMLRGKFLKDSTFVEEEDLYMCSLFPARVIEEILDEFNPRSVLDVGCGTGVSLAYFLQKNIQAIGVENSAIAIKKSKVAEKIIKHNLKKELDLQKKFDLVWSFEVIEHIHPNYESIFLNTLINHSDRIIISAARPGQGGHGHFNEQHPEYWIEKFKFLHFKLNQEMTERLRNTKETHSENILVFEREV